MTTRRQFWLTLCGATRLLRAQGEPEFIADVQDISVDTAVTRNQRPLRGLRAEDFVLLDNGQPQSIRAVTNEELPLDLVMIFHTFPQEPEAKSKAGQLFEQAKARLLNGAANVLLLTRPEDRIAFLTHTSPPRIELPFTNDRDAFAAALRRVASLEYNPVFSEVVTFEYAVRMLAELGLDRGRRRLIVRVGTVPGQGLPYLDDTVIRRLWSESVIFSSIEILGPGGGFNPGFYIPEIMPIGVGGGPEPDGPLYRISNPFHIAAATGGDTVSFLDPKDPQDLLSRLRQRYILWFRQPEGLEPGQQRSISVELSPDARQLYPDAVVQARSGYVAGSR